MLTVTSSLPQAFELKLSLRNNPDQQRHNFHNWLRFYMDFSINTAITRPSGSLSNFDSYGNLCSTDCPVFGEQI